MEKIFYACSGPANLIRTKLFWSKGLDDPNEVAITFSGQILDYCKNSGSSIYMMSQNPDKKLHRDENITIAHRPKYSISSHGALGFHISEVMYGVRLLIAALKYRADVALIDSGVTHYFVLFLFRMFGIKVIIILHNTLWPSGFPPSRLIPRLIQWVDKWFFIYGANAIIGVSNECRNQVVSLAGSRTLPKIFQTRAQFDKSFFERVAPPQYTDKQFTIMFMGRIEKYKGVFDIVEMAEKLEQKYPNKFRWRVYGTGSDLDALKALVIEKKLSDVFNVAGWINLEQVIQAYSECHLSIVPTTSGFNEGLAMTVVESILAGRPVITSQVVPAMNEVKSACYEAVTNDVNSYVLAVERIASDQSLYESMVLACKSEGMPFLDRSNGLSSVLKQAITYIA